MDENENGEEMEQMQMQMQMNDLDNFKETVRTYLKIDDDIKKLEVVLKELRKKKKDKEKPIMDFMGKYEIEDCNTGDGKLHYQVSSVFKPVNRENLKKQLCKFFKNEKLGEECTNYIYENREKEQKIQIRRIFNKEKKEVDLI
jgi:hypothetical protein